MMHVSVQTSCQFNLARELKELELF